MNHFSNRNFRLRASRFVVVAMTLLCIAAIFVPTLTAQTASAGAVIGNQATATYNDAQGVSRQAFSNLVQTTVSQVYSGTLTSTQSRYASVGTQVVFPHTYTNNGNGSDTVTIGYNTPTAGFTNPAIYMDANEDGVPDNTTNINGSAFVLAANQVLKFVVVGTLGTSAGTTETVRVTAVSAGGGTVTGNPNTDTITKTTNAAIAVTKSMSASSGVGGNVVGVTLTYTNTGNSTATAVVIGDPLGSTTNAFAYVAGSGKLNGATLTDGSGGWIVTGNTPTLTIASVAPGVTGTITFNVTVGASVVIGGTINNTATFMYNDGAIQIPPAGTINTNTVPFTIQQNAAVTWTAGDAVGFTGGNPATDNLGAQTFNQGGVITFIDTVTNSGNGFDTLNITYNNVSFPAGTAFEFFRADGLTPLTDSNNDGIIDVGPVAAGATATIKVKANLPASTVVGATWQVNVVATSTASTANNFATASATIYDKVTATVATSTVDLTVTNFANGTGSVGKGSGITSGVTSTVNPGAQIIFPFYVQNTSLQSTTNADSYSLTVQSTTATGTVTVPFAGSAIPTGWTAIFHQASGASCPAAYAAQSSPITLTGALTAANSGSAASSYQLFCLEVDVPAGYVGGTKNFLVQALSSSTAAIDQMQFAVAVNTIHLVTVTPNQSGQVYAGGTVNYKHQITNGGNSDELVVFPAGSTVVFNPALSGWTATVYQDSNSNGVLDGTDSIVASGPTAYPLAIGQSIVVFVKIQASAAANPGDSTVSTLTITYASSSTSAADDTTAVIAGQIKLLKSQFVDNGCTKTAGTFTTAIVPVPSGQCIIYQIQATNSGTTNVTGVTFADAAPAFTTYLAGYTTTNTNTCSLTGGTVTVVGGTATPFTAAFVGPMTPSCTATITFEVKLN